MPTTPKPKPNELLEKIRAFATSEEHIGECLAFLKVGHDKGDKPEVIIARIILNTLLRFHGLPVKVPGQN